MATPHVSGAAALLLSVDDTLTVRELKDYLMDYIIIVTQHSIDGMILVMQIFKM